MSTITQELEMIRNKQKGLADEYRKLAREIFRSVGVISHEEDKDKAAEIMSQCLMVLAVRNVSPESERSQGDIADFLADGIIWLIEIGRLSLASNTLKQILATDQRWKSELGGLFVRLSRAYVELAFKPNTSLDDAKSHLEEAFKLAKQSRDALNLRDNMLFSLISGFRRMQGKPTGYLVLANLAAEDEKLSGDGFEIPESLMLESLRVYITDSPPLWIYPEMSMIGNADIQREYNTLIEIAEKRGKKEAANRLRKRMEDISLLVRVVTWKDGIEKGLSLYQQAIELFDASSNDWYSGVARRSLAQFYYTSADFKKALAAYEGVRYRNFGDNYFLLCCRLQMVLEKIIPPRRKLITQYDPVSKRTP